MNDNNLDEFSDSVGIPPDMPKKIRTSLLKKDEKEEEVKNGRTQWSTYGPGGFISCGKTGPKLPAGVFDIALTNTGEPIFTKRAINVDGLMEFPDSQADKILSDIDLFWKRGKEFEKYGYLHRRGYLLYGPPGSGKTIIIQQTIHRIVHSGGMVLMCGHPNTLAIGLGVLREVEPKRPLVCVFEDIDSIVRNYGEDYLLSVLDGESQINRVLNVASTNYPENLDRRIVGRPRRFDRVIKIGMPTEIVREAYFKNKLLIENPTTNQSKELEIWVKETDGFSFASMAELVISVKCLGNKFDESIKLLRKLMERKPSSEDYDEKMGFGFGKE